MQFAMMSMRNNENIHDVENGYNVAVKRMR